MSAPTGARTFPSAEPIRGLSRNGGHASAWNTVKALKNILEKLRV
jgi:hypothetical protein